MARIRYLKPHIWTSRDVVRLTAVGRLVFVVLITQADDEGRLHGDPHHLATVYLAGSGASTVEVASQLKQMQRLRMVQQYRDSSGEYCFAILNWAAHQKIDHPTPSRIQKPPQLSRVLARFREASDRKGGKGKEGKEGKEGYISAVANGSGLALIDSEALNPRQSVFEAWIRSTGRTGRTQLDGKRARLIDQALAVYPIKDVLDAVQGWSQSPHHRGENDRATVYNDLELLLRDAEHIERFRDLTREGGPPVPVKKSSSQNLSDLYRKRAASLRKQGL